jgi:hexosaminidase
LNFRRILGLLAPLLIAAAPAPRLLPSPASLTVRSGGFSLDKGAVVVIAPGDDGARNAAARLTGLLAASGIALTVSTQASDTPTIRFVRGSGIPAEGYRIETGGAGAVVTASDDAGLFYGAVTLWQLATQTDTPGHIAGISIMDEPRFKWRGILLDSARHYQSPAYIRRMIDWLAVNKLNTLHWHLVDDQSWRLEIKAYPKLTRVAAFRRPATAPGAPRLPVTGGFYTQAEVRALVAYAQARGVTIVPEIEMPGHATSAILAYPELGTGTPLPASSMGHWGVFPSIYRPSDRTFKFLKTVLTETMALFPSRYIHIGGDVPVFDRWKADPQVQAQMRRLGLKDEQALHGWFMARMASFLDAHGRRAIGWDEILDGGAPQSTTIMSWRGIDGAIKAARDGHDTVLSPSPDLYIDHMQGLGPQEPPGRGGVISLKQVYAFDPAPASLTPDQRHHIIGVQANVWSEHIRTEARNAWMTFPRASALAEVAWSRGTHDSYDGFLARLTPQLDRMRALGLTAANSAFVPVPAPAALLRTSRQLDSCTDGAILDLEDDYPAKGPRAHFLMNILKPCWIWRDAPLGKGAGIALKVGQVPFNFEVSADKAAMKFAPPRSPAGEFEVHTGDCNGPLLATLPLAPAAPNPGVTRLTAGYAGAPARADLCITYTARGPDPLWGVDSIAILPR